MLRQLTVQRTLLRIMPIFLILVVFTLLFWRTNGAERIFGILILIALVIINAPAFFTRNRIRALPVEIELLLLAMVFLS